MLVKKLGITLVYSLKLYKLIKLLTLPLIVLVFVLPLTEWNLNQAKEKFEFQEPSLRTKLFDLDYSKHSLEERISYRKVGFGVQAFVFPGMLSNQCILLTFPQNFSQTLTIKTLHQTLKNDRALAKNVVLLSYNNIESLKQLFKSFLSGEESLNFGVIRASLNIDLLTRTKEKSKPNELKAFFEIYSKGGIHVDADYFQSIKQLLERLHIDWSPCAQIHQNPLLKQIKNGVYTIAQYVGTPKSRISQFTDHVLCQSHTSLFDKQTKAHEVLMNYGFQASSLTFLTPLDLTTSDITSHEQNQKIAKLAYSFVKEYSMQEDHLHSSATLFYPIDNHHFVTLIGTVFCGLVLLIVGVVNVVGYLVEQSQNVRSTATLFNLIEAILFWCEFKLHGDLTLSLSYLLVKLILKMIYSLSSAFKNKNQSNYISLENLVCSGFQFLLSLYLSIFNFSLFYVSCILSCITLIKAKKIVWILILGTFVMWINANIDTIKSQTMGISSSNFSQFVKDKFLQSIQFIKSLSIQVKIIFLPFLYGISTFLNSN